jgi:serine/threonine-protein kinase
MRSRFESCDPRRLDLFLHRQLPDKSERDLEIHLLACPACRDKLDELAGGVRWWTEVRRYLGGDGAAELPSPPAAAPLDLGFLQPSAKPASLGRLGDYEVLEVLGRGGMGVVLKGFDASLHRLVAIKVLAKEYAANGTARKRFTREAQAAAAVVHDHIVPVYAVDAAASPPYFVMAFIPGQSLQQRLDRSGPLELKEILRIGMQTAAGLAAAHAQGLVHRDIKPANIMLENGVERVRITDFGLARAVDDVTVTLNGAVAGTPQYMAPEQARAEPVDQRADLFSLGSMLYATCTGRAPFRGDTALAIIRQVCDVEPPPIRAINPDIPAWLAGIVRKLQSKDPADRFASAAEVADLLEQCLAHVQQPEHMSLPLLARELGERVQEQARPKPRRWRRIAITMAAAIILIGLPLTWRFWRSPPAGAQASQSIAGNSAALIGVSDFSIDQVNELRERLHGLRQSVAATADEEMTADQPASARLRHRAAILREEIMKPAAQASDPIDDRVAEIVERLRVVERSLKGTSD